MYFHFRIRFLFCMAIYTIADIIYKSDVKVIHLPINTQSTSLNHSIKTTIIDTNYKLNITKDKSNHKILYKLKVSKQIVKSKIYNIAKGLQIKVSSIYHRIRRRKHKQKIKIQQRIDNTLKYFNTSLFSYCDYSNLTTKYGDLKENVELALTYLSKDDGYWTFIGEDNDIKVWKTSNPLCISKEDKKWVCVMTKSVIHASPESLKNLLLDSDKVILINKYSEGRKDIEIINKNCKVVWNRTRIPLSSSSFDFCTLMQDYTDPNTGMIMIISKSVEHPDAPITKKYSRSNVIFGLNVLIPSNDNKDITHFISINHVKYTGLGVHPIFARANAFKGTVNYMKQLKAIAPLILTEL